MLSISEKADWKTPGLKGRMKNGIYKGKLYTAMPWRLLTAGKNAVIASILITALLMWAADEGFEILDTIYVFIGVFVLLAYPFFVVFDPGKKIKITPQHLHVGSKRYDLHSCGRFFPLKTGKGRLDDIITFEYGNNQKRIRIRNGWRHTENIVQKLNDSVKLVCAHRQTQQTALRSRLETRSATF
ncbi:hypothetical protein [Hyphococcus luteus]|uniref:Uncharacterized protein n=1 Tax=Hyphococcus luteus TaxID=2058213 RepID=A0A2S7K0J3_9PROT|nr:hypothetical protein [Marinicaulis flavus]PQA86030.1 hypothetical protein CW354_16755 [Marinicaulis flavus]